MFEFEIPSWAALPEFKNRRKVQILGGWRDPNHSRNARNVHPDGWGSDIEVRWDPELESYHAYLNWPARDNTGTQIAYTLMRQSGDLCHQPEVVLTAKGNRQILGYETPSVIRWGNSLIGATLTKQNVSDGRRDIVELWTLNDWDAPWERTNYAIEPEHPWESRWIDRRTGEKTGGLQEPALFTLEDPNTGLPVLGCGYTAATYAPGYRPSTGLSWLTVGGLGMQKWPTPIIPNSGQINIWARKHPRGVPPFDRIFYGLYQNRPGTGQSEIEYRVSFDLLRWSKPKVLIAPDPDGPDSAKVVAPCLQWEGPMPRLWWFGSNGTPNNNWIMVADAEE